MKKREVLDLEGVEDVAQRPDQAAEVDQRAAQLGEARRARPWCVLAHQALLDVVEAVAELLDQRLEPVGGAEAEAGDEIGGAQRRVVGLLPLRDAEELGDVELGGDDHPALLDAEGEELAADILGIGAGAGDAHDHHRLVVEHRAARAGVGDGQQVGGEVADLLLEPDLELGRLGVAGDERRSPWRARPWAPRLRARA